jgi:hypothetical protein
VALGMPQIFVHGSADDIVPLELSESYHDEGENEPIAHRLAHRVHPSPILDPPINNGTKDAEGDQGENDHLAALLRRNKHFYSL